MDIKKALEELKKGKKRNFIQTVDLIINLKNFDPKKEKVNFYFELPHAFKEKKIAIILEKGSDEIAKIIDQIAWKDIEGMDLKEFKKKIEKNYDYFIALAKVVPLIAKKFGKVLGPRKKMPDPKLGAILQDLDVNKIKQLVERLKKTVRVANDGNSVKIAIGKENMDVKEIQENFDAFYKELIKNLPSGEHNIKEILIKLTMSKPVKLSKEK